MNKNKIILDIAMSLIFGIILISILPAVSALGISPGRTTLEFEAGAEQEITLNVLNNEKKDLSVVIYAEGELAQYVTLETPMLEIGKNEESKSFKYKVKLPSELEKPGLHEGKIIAREIPKQASGQTFIGASVAVVSQLHVNIPYPGKYAEVNLEISEVKIGESAAFVVSVYNRGKLDIVRAKAIIDILGPTNEKIATIQTDEKGIKTAERKELVSAWKPENPGEYKALVTLTYDEQVARTEKVFAIGSLEVEILSAEVKNFNLGGVAKFTVLAENKYNNRIDDLYTQMIITDKKGDLMVDSKSATISLEPLSKGTMFTYWDTEGISTGEYDGKFILSYQGKKSEKLAKTIVDMNSISVDFGGITGQVVAAEGGIRSGSVLMIAIIILIVINVAWFVWFRKKLKKIRGK